VDLRTRLVLSGTAPFRPGGGAGHRAVLGDRVELGSRSLPRAGLSLVSTMVRSLGPGHQMLDLVRYSAVVDVASTIGSQ
jgi:hypothetical protein